MTGATFGGRIAQRLRREGYLSFDRRSIYSAGSAGCAKRLVRAAIVFTAFAVVSSCSALRPVDLPEVTTSAPSHSTIWQQLDADHQDDWFALLNVGPDALDWRLRAIDTATESIDLQTFLWTLDTTGRLMLDRLLAAADRGVLVKILIDDSLLTGTDAVFAELAQHPNVEYRVFNPFKRRAVTVAARWALNFSEFDRLDHRMHNKAMVIDNRVAIVGGRNLAD